MTWLRNLAFGSAAFGAAHALEVYRWREWFDPENRHEPWFLNSGSALILTLAAVAAAAAAGVLLSSRGARNASRQSLQVAGGAVLAMAITIFVIGPGTIFPIVLAMGATLMTLGALLGGLLGFAAAWCLGARLDRPEPP